MSFLNYILQFFTTILALLLLTKDWEALKKPYVRYPVFVLIILVGAGALLNNYLTTQHNEKIRQQDNAAIIKLQQALDTSEQNRKDNTKEFLAEFSRLSQQVSELETEIQTAEFKKKAADLQADLETTRKALFSPKATLAFTFAKPHNDAPIIRTASFPVKDNVVHIDFAVENSTDVPAVDGHIILQICNACEFASEPPNFKKIHEGKDTERIRHFRQLLPKTLYKDFNADVKVPASIDRMEFGISYRCVTCIVPEPKANFGTVILSR